MGKADATGFELYPLKMALEEIKADWLARRKLPNVASARKLLRRYRATNAKRRELRKQFAPAVREAIAMAGWLRANPNADEKHLRGLVEERDSTMDLDLAEVEEQEDRDIEFVINRADDYRKRQVRKLAVEPFLLLLEEYGVVPHPKQLPLNRMMHAFLDWVGIEQRRRPTDAGIRTIARDLRKRGQRG
jgi:hypothetical protein